MKKLLVLFMIAWPSPAVFCWGFYAHQQINYHAVFLLPPEMMLLFKPQILFLSEHAVDPDKRRYAIPEEGPRHYIDLDHYGAAPYKELPRKWKEAEEKLTADSLQAHGILPWWLQTMLNRLTEAFKAKDQWRILKYAAELGHYIADAHVPLHTSSNHNGQFTDQKGIHAFWESRIPELLAEKHWDFFLGKAEYIGDPSAFFWKKILQSAAAADTVLILEKQLSRQFPPDQRFSFEERNGLVIRQYSTAYTLAYDKVLSGMVERRMRESIFAVASCWYTAWVNAGQPDLTQLVNKNFTEEDRKEFDELNRSWRNGKLLGREE